MLALWVHGPLNHPVLAAKVSPPTRPPHRGNPSVRGFPIGARTCLGNHQAFAPPNPVGGYVALGSRAKKPNKCVSRWLVPDVRPLQLGPVRQHYRGYQPHIHMPHDGQPHMPRRPPATQEPDLLDLLEEQTTGPRPCSHRFSAGKHGHAWVLDVNPRSPYFREWIHSDPNCRRSAFPGQHKETLPTMGWDPKLQKDVPL